MLLTSEEEQAFIERNKKYSVPQNDFLAAVAEMPRDQAVKILRLATATGLDPAEAAKYSSTAVIQNLIGASDFEDVGKFAPKTYSFLSDPLHMAIVRDKRNIMTLADLENENKVWTSFKNGVKGIGRGIIGAVKGLVEGSVYSSLKNDIPFADEQVIGSDISGAQIKKDVKDFQPEPLSESILNSDWLKHKEVKAETAIGQYGLDFVSLAPQIAAQIAAAVLTGGTGSMLFMGTQIAGSEYEKLRKEGVQADRAFQAATLDAIAQAPLERIGLSKIMKKIPANSPLKFKIREIIEAGLTEGITEWIQQYPEAAIEIWAKHPEYTPEQRGEAFIRDFLEITKEGAYQGLVAAPFGFLGGAVNVSMQKKMTEAFVAKLDTQQAILANSPILQISPELAEKHLEAVTEGEKTYIEPDAVLTLYQSGLLPQDEIDTLLGTTAAEVAEAASSGQMVEVSTAKYTVATAQHPEIHQALKEDIAPDEDGYTLRRLKEKNVREVNRAREEVKRREKEVKEVSDSIYQNMIEAGAKPEVAKSAIVALVKNAYVMSDNPAQWLRDKAPIFQKGTIPAAGALHQFAGPGAKTADHLGLNQARQMDKDGADNEAIRKATGWFRGMDGKWRFEIDDSQAKLIDLAAVSKRIQTLYKQAHKIKDEAKKEEALAQVEAEENELTKPRLKNVLDHPALYKAYPWIGDVKVIQSKLPKGENGGYDPATNTIQLSRDLSPEKMKETLLHEVQHVIQEQENFARGGSPQGNTAEAFDQYQRQAGEIEARDTAKRANLTAEQRKEIAPDLRSDAIIVFGGREYGYQSGFATEENITKGTAAMQEVIQNHTDVLNAMYRPEVGGISFYWGNPGKGPKLKKGGGVSHLIARRNSEGQDGEAVAMKMVEVIAKGSVGDIYGPENGKRVNITHDGYTAVLSLYKAGTIETWLLSGWKNNEEASGAVGEGYGSTDATLSGPMRTRPEEGADASLDNSIPKPGELFQSEISPKGSIHWNKEDKAIANLFIAKSNGSIDFGAITKEDAGKAKKPIVPAPIRLQVGFDVNGVGKGYMHLKKREKSIIKVGYGSIEDFISDVATNFNEIRENQKGRLLLVKTGEPNMVASIELEEVVEGSERYYTVITAMPVREKNKKYFAKYELLLDGRPSPSLHSDLEVNSGENSQNIGESNPQGAYDRSNSDVISIAEAEKLFQSVRENNARGSIHWNEEGRAIITLFENHDPSTLIHEMVGHYFMQNLIEMGAKEDAPGWMKRDRKTVLDWAANQDVKGELKKLVSLAKSQNNADMVQKLTDAIAYVEQGGNTIEAASDINHAHNTAIKAAFHEFFARAAEAYFLEGKAPSLETRGIFRRFKDWLLAIYKTVKNLGVNITPEIRAVFDRMLATEEEIAQVELLGEYHQRLPKEILDTLSESQKTQLDKAIIAARENAENILREKVMRFIGADNQYEMDKAREELTAQITEEINKEPLYLAADQIANNFQKDAKVVAQAFKDSLRFGQDLAKGLSQDQEAEFEYLADMFGFSSGDELATKILNSNTKAEEIAYRVQAQMNIRFKDLMQNPDIMRKEAEEAVYNDDGATLIALENQAIQEALGKIQTREEARKAAIAARESAKAVAREKMAAMPLEKAMKLQSYMATERRAAEKANKAMSKGDLAKAREYKEAQLISHAMVMESLRLRREYERITKYIKRQQKADRDTWEKEEHFVQSAKILRRFGYAHKQYDPNVRRETLQAWATRMNEETAAVSIADWLFDEKYENMPKNLTIEQLKDVENALRNIKHLAQTEDRLYATFDKADRREKIKEAQERLANRKDVYVPEFGEEEAERKGNWWRGYWFSAKKFTQIVNELDGNKDFGFFYKLLYEGVYKAANKMSDIVHGLKNELAKAFGLYTKKELHDMVNKKQYYPELGVSANKMTIMQMALHTGSESNRHVLFGVPPIGLEKSSLWVEGKPQETEARIMEFLGRTLDARDWKFVQSIWDIIDSLWPMANDMHKEMTGFSMEKVEAKPFTVTLADGSKVNINGGYFPLKEDSRSRLKAAQRSEEGLDPLYTERSFIWNPTTRTGYTKSRSGAAYPISLDASNIYRHLIDVSHDIAFRPVVTDLRRLVKNKDFEQLMKRKLGPEGYNIILDFVATAANAKTDAAGMGRGLEWLGRVLNVLRERVVIAQLMFRMKTLLQNFANPFLYGDAVDGFTHADALRAFVQRGMLEYWTPSGYSQMKEFVLSKSAFMRDKLETPDFTFHDLHDQVTGEQSKVVKFGTMLLAETDNLTNIPMWLEAYHKKIDEGASEYEAIRFADTLVDRATGSGRKIDTALLLRSNAAIRIFTMFQTFMNTQLNAWIREYKIFVAEKDVPRLLAFVAARWWMFVAASMLLGGEWPDEEKDGDKWLQKLVSEILGYPMRLAPIAGDVFAIALDQALGLKTFGYRISPVQGVVESGLRTGSAIKGWLEDKKETKDLLETASTFGAFALPYPDQFNDWFWNAYDILFNDMEPEMRDLIRRRPRRER